MKVLFMIPKNDPPKLDGNFSPKFVDFVSQCLRKDPQDRPTALELLQHPFIRSSKHISNLTELLERKELAQSTSDFERDGGSFHNGRNPTSGYSSLNSDQGRSIKAAVKDSAANVKPSQQNDQSNSSSMCHSRLKPNPVDSGWDFNTVRLSTTSAAIHADSSKSNVLAAVGLPPMIANPTVGALNVPKDWRSSSTTGLSDSGITLSSSMASGFGSYSDAGDATVEVESHEEVGGEGPDAEAFASIVKPAIFEVLDRVVSERTAAEALSSPYAREEALAAAELKEELLFEFLHAFDSLTQQRGLLTEVLTSVVEFANAVGGVQNATSSNSSGSSSSASPVADAPIRAESMRHNGGSTVASGSGDSSHRDFLDNSAVSGFRSPPSHRPTTSLTGKPQVESFAQPSAEMAAASKSSTSGLMRPTPSATHGRSTSSVSNSSGAHSALSGAAARPSTPVKAPLAQSSRASSVGASSLSGAGLVTSRPSAIMTPSSSASSKSRTPVSTSSASLSSSSSSTTRSHQLYKPSCK